MQFHMRNFLCNADENGLISLLKKLANYRTVKLEFGQMPDGYFHYSTYDRQSRRKGIEYYLTEASPVQKAIARLVKGDDLVDVIAHI